MNNKNKDSDIDSGSLRPPAPKPVAEIELPELPGKPVLGVLLNGEGEKRLNKWAQDYARAAIAAALASHSPAKVEGTVDEVLAEIERAVRKFPTWPTDPLHAVSIFGEESGELTKAVLQAVYEPHKSTPADVRDEAIQTAAMAIRFLRSMDRYAWARGEQHSQSAIPVLGANEGDR